jgi:D-alanyl-D-alanine carboxypeptidase
MQTYVSWVRQLGEQKADGLSARPGYSEHQLGTAVDFVNKATGYKIVNDFGNTPAGKWLAENSYKYGFILPYKSDQSNAGGYQEESWHFRFTGVPEQVTGNN